MSSNEDEDVRQDKKIYRGLFVKLIAENPVVRQI